MTFKDGFLRRLSTWRKRTQIVGTEVESIVGALNRLGLGETLRCGELVCAYCGRSLTLESLSGLFVSGKRPIVFCDQTDCVFRGTHKASVE